MHTGFIYCERNTENGMNYVGQTRKTLSERRRNHAHTYQTSTQRIHEAMRNSGLAAFVQFCLQELTAPTLDELKHALNEAEAFWIMLLRSYHPDFGYNDIIGSMTGKGYRWTKQFRERVSARRLVTCNTPEAKERFSKQGRENFARLSPEVKEQWRERIRKLHAFKRPDASVGSHNGRAKLTEEQVREIRKLAASKTISQQKIADMYGVTQMLVSKIHRRRLWPHLI